MELACQTKDKISLDALIVMAIRLENLLRELRCPPRHSPPSFGCPEAEPEILEVGATHFFTSKRGRLR
jgi:hypothetical protein